MSYAQRGQWFGCVKSAWCRWRRREPLRAPEFEETATLEMDGLWTRRRAGATELQVIRDAKGVVLGAFGSWEGVIDQAWPPGAVDPAHLDSDGAPVIAAGLGMVYGRPAPRRLCQFHLLRECRRNIGGAGWAAARQLLAAESVVAAQRWAQRVVDGLDRRSGKVLVSQGAAGRIAAFDNRARAVQDYIAAGTAQSGVAPTGKDGHGMVASQPDGTAPKSGADQSNHLKWNATEHDGIPNICGDWV